MSIVSVVGIYLLEANSHHNSTAVASSYSYYVVILALSSLSTAPFVSATTSYIAAIFATSGLFAWALGWVFSIFHLSTVSTIISQND